MTVKLKTHLVPAPCSGGRTQHISKLGTAALEFWLEQWNGLESPSLRELGHTGQKTAMDTHGLPSEVTLGSVETGALLQITLHSQAVLTRS